MEFNTAAFRIQVDCAYFALCFLFFMQESAKEEKKAQHLHIFFFLYVSNSCSIPVSSSLHQSYPFLHLFLPLCPSSICQAAYTSIFCYICSSSALLFLLPSISSTVPASLSLSFLSPHLSTPSIACEGGGVGGGGRQVGPMENRSYKVPNPAAKHAPTQAGPRFLVTSSLPASHVTA